MFQKVIGEVGAGDLLPGEIVENEGVKIGKQAQGVIRIGE